MNTKTIISIILLVLVIVGGYFVVTHSKTNSSPESEEVSNENPTENERKMAFFDLVKQGDSYKCTIDIDIDYNIDSAASVDYSGTAYMYNGMVRAEYSGKVQDQEIVATTIVRDGYAYGWVGSSAKLGFKQKIDPSLPNAYDFNKSIADYDCDNWTPDPSKFELPSIKFIDFNDSVSSDSERSDKALDQ